MGQGTERDQGGGRAVCCMEEQSAVDTGHSGGPAHLWCEQKSGEGVSRRKGTICAKTARWEQTC